MSFPLPPARARLFLVGLVLGSLLTAGVLLVPDLRRSEPAPDGAPAPSAAADLRVQVTEPPDGRSLDQQPGEQEPAPEEPEAAAEPEAEEHPHGQHQCEAADDDEGALCVHGSEPPPPGVDTRTLPTVAQLRSRRFGGTVPGKGQGQGKGEVQEDAEAPAAGTAGTAEGEVVTPEEVAASGVVPCVGDGTSGQRVKAIYAHAADRPNRYTELLPLIQQYAADVSSRINLAAGRSDRGLLVRFVTAGKPCVLAVDNVTLSASGDDSFGASVAELRAKGYDRSDRKYLVWVDAAVGICGIAHVYDDDKPTLDNLNTRGGMFARTDAPCFGYAELHELLHTLGAVQDSAPRSTKAGHCVDQTDTMCYSDTSGATMRKVCSDAPVWHVDCRLDDYFNAAPPAGSYLATHWNSARSPYLQAAEAPPQPAGIDLTSVATSFAGNAWTVSAGVDLPAGRSIAAFRWTTTRSDCRFVDPTARTTRYWCPVTAAGAGQVTATLRDSAGLETSRSRAYDLVVPRARRKVGLGLRPSTSTVRAGRSVTLRSALADAANGKAVIGMPVSLYRRTGSSSTWEKVATRRTGRTGRVAFVVKPTRRTDYLTVSGTTTTWASGRSPERRITVKR